MVLTLSLRQILILCRWQCLPSDQIPPSDSQAKRLPRRDWNCFRHASTWRSPFGHRRDQQDEDHHPGGETGSDPLANAAERTAGHRHQQSRPSPAGCDQAAPSLIPGQTTTWGGSGDCARQTRPVAASTAQPGVHQQPLTQRRLGGMHGDVQRHSRCSSMLQSASVRLVRVIEP